MKNLIFAITFIMALTIVNISPSFADTNNVTVDNYSYIFQFQEPYVDDNSIYIVYLLENPDTGVHTVQLQYCTIIPRYTSDNSEYDMSDDVFFSLYLGSTSSTIYFNASSTTLARGYSWRVTRANTSIITVTNSNFTTQTSATVNWDNIGYKCIGYEIIGSNYVIESGIAGKTTFTYFFSDEYSVINLMYDILQEIALNTEITSDELEVLSSILDELQTNNSNTLTIISKLTAIAGNTENLEYYLDLLYSQANRIYAEIDYVDEHLLATINNLQLLLTQTVDINDKLQQLIDLWTPHEDENKYPEVDTSKQDQYVELGNNLTSKDTTTSESDLSINVNTNAGGYVWNLFNNFISSNEKVIGMYITLLSCAFIALILNR